MSEQQLATKESKAPVPMSSKGVQLQDFDAMARFCQAVSSSGLAPKGLETPQQIMVAVQQGLEIGLGPMQALQSIAVINNRPCLWGDAALALASGHKDFINIEETFDDKTMTATCKIERRGRTPVERSFSKDDAVRASKWDERPKVTRKNYQKGTSYEADNDSPWYRYPKRMLQMRARAFALRDSFPDALKGVGIREEVADFDTRPIQGRVIEKPQLVLPDAEDATEPAANFPQEEEQDETGFKF